MVRRRGILVVLAALLAAVVALLGLSSAWRERSIPPRARERSPDGAAPDGLAATGSGSAAIATGDKPPTETQALVRGIVTGPTGGIWGVRVVAYGAEDGAVLAETSTNPKGLYSLVVKPDVEFVLAAEPGPETGLLAVRRAGISVAPGEEREENISAAEGASLSGRLVDVDGNGEVGIELFAVHPEDLAQAGDRPASIAGIAAARMRSGRDGAFRLRGLAPGAYAVVITDPDWMLPSPVSARTDGPDLSLVVVPALTVHLFVKNVETGEPVDPFSVRVRAADRVLLDGRVMRAFQGEPGWRVRVGDRVLLDGAGAAGVFSRRVPFPGQRDETAMVLVDVSASGFVPAGPVVNPPRGAQLVWLIPRRDPNTTIRVSFDDRQPYRGALYVVFVTKGDWGGKGSIKFERVKEGVYRGALPLGRWDLVLAPVAFFGGQRFPAEADVRGDPETELSLVLPAGGTILLSPPLGSERSVAWIRSAEEAERGTEGTQLVVSREGFRIEGIPPGMYQLGYQTSTEVLEGRFLYQTVWFRDVNVVLGGTEEIVLP